MQTYMALDLGGTKLLIGELDKDGNILRSKRYPSGYTSQQATVEGVLACIEDYKKTVGFEGEVAAVGMGMVGMVDHRNGIWRSLGHIVQDEIPFADILSEAFSAPAAIDNDVKSAATAEIVLGCGKTTKDFIYINVGTGLAAACIVDGKIIRGKHDLAGEVGHMSLDLYSDNYCGCGRNGCCEKIVSGMGFHAQVLRYKDQYPNTALAIPEENVRVNAKDIFELYDKGDEMCVRIVDEAVDTLVCLILDLIRVTDPDTIILGGGVVSSGWLLEKVNAKLEKYSIMRHITGGVRLSQFDADKVGLIGAGALGMVKSGNFGVIDV